MKETFKQQLADALGRKYIDRIVEQVAENPSCFADLYALTKDEDETTAWRAAWACEKLSICRPGLFAAPEDLRSELMLRVQTCKHGGIRRLLLNMLLHLPVFVPIDVPFLNFCLGNMLSPSETPAGQAASIKLAYALCCKEPELLEELRLCLENMEPEYYTAAVQCARSNVLKKIRNTWVRTHGKQ